MSTAWSIAFLCLLAALILQTWRRWKLADNALFEHPKTRDVDPMLERFTNHGTIRIYDGARPVCHHMNPGEQSVLAELEWRSDSPSFNGVLDLKCKQSTILRDGAAKWFRLFTSEGIAMADGSITSRFAASKGNMTLDDIDLKKGQAIALPYFTLTDSVPKARKAV